MEDLIEVGRQDLEEQVVYLGNTPVSWTAKRLQAGVAKLQKGRIKSVSELGDLNSIFSNLGDLFAAAEVGRQKFQIKHVRTMLLDPRCGDDFRRNRLDKIEAGLRNGSINPNITVFDGMVIDGNKTAAAYHDIHQAAPEIDLPVYVIIRN